MSLKKIMSISGMPGLYQVVAQTKNGFIVESLVDGKRQAVSSFQKISILEDVTMYGKTEDKRLREIFTSMRGMDAEVAAVNPKAEAAELKAFLNKVFVDNDSERIYASDIKKLVQWYQILRNRDNIDELLKEEEVSTEEEVASDVTAQTQDPQLATTETIEEAAPKKTRKKKDSDELSDDTATAEKPKKPRAAKKKEE